MPRGIYKRSKKAKTVHARVKRMIYATGNRIAPSIANVGESVGVTDEVWEPQSTHESGARWSSNVTPQAEAAGVADWINAAPTPAERQLRKQAMHRASYSLGSNSLLAAAEAIREQMSSFAERQKQLKKENIFNPDVMFAQPPIYHDPVNHPAHYLRHPSGVECIQITEHFNFNRGNAIKYIWRADEKGSTLENLRKAAWYLNREIERLEKEATR